MSKRVVLIEGGSADEDTLTKVRAEIPPGARVMVVLDSDHSRDHVLAECRACADLVTEGCYLVVADTVIGFMTPDQTPKKRSKIWYPGDETLSGMHDFLAENSDFEPDQVSVASCRSPLRPAVICAAKRPDPAVKDR